MTDVKDGKLSDFRPQAKNANAHTERGLKLLGNAYSEVGYVAPMTATADGEIIDGSARLEVAFDQFPDDALIVRHDGQRPVIMVREDIVSADTPEAKKISYSANRVGELDLSWNPETILADLESGVDLSGLFREDELERILGTVVDDPNGEWGGMPEFEQEDAFGAIATVKVHFVSTDDIQEFSRLVGQTVTEKSTFIWYPKRAAENLKLYQVQDEQS